MVIQVLMAIYPLAQLQEPFSAIQYLAERVAVEHYYGLRPDPDSLDIQSDPPSDSSEDEFLDVNDGYDDGSSKRRGGKKKKNQRSGKHKASRAATTLAAAIAKFVN